MTSAFKPLTKKDIASLLDVCDRTIENWVSDGTMPAPKKLGNRAFWHPSAFYSWLEGRLTSDDAPNEIAPLGGALPTNEEHRGKPKVSAKPPKNELEKYRARDQAKLDKMLSGL
jgi:predicted DNA-binding transcriptional regulator AlpA